MLAAAARAAARASCASAATVWRAAASSAPRVADHIVTVHLVLPSGERRALRGLEGDGLLPLLVENADSLVDAANAHAVPPVALSPAGRGAADAVVEVPNEVVATMAPAGAEEEAAVAELAARVKPNSRLASAVTLRRSFDGATLALAELRPWATL